MAGNFSFPAQTWELSTQTDQTAGRALDTVYQNTGSGTRFVVITIQACNNNTTFTAYCDSATPPTLVIGLGSSAGVTAVSFTLTFFVLPNHYYKLSRSAANGTILKWVEYD